MVGRRLKKKYKTNPVNESQIIGHRFVYIRNSLNHFNKQNQGKFKNSVQGLTYGGKLVLAWLQIISYFSKENFI